MDVKVLSSSTLAFVGDAYYSLIVREMLAKVNRPLGELHKASVTLVKAPAQAAAFKVIKDRLTEEEMDIYKRGRNTHVNTVPKNSSVGEYHSATGLEALFGYLYLAGQEARARELFEYIRESYEKEG